MAASAPKPKARTRTSTTTVSGPGTVLLDVKIDPKDIAKAVKLLDKYQGAPLAVRTDKASKAGMKLFVNPAKAQAARHNLTGATQRGYNVRKLKKRTREVSAYKVDSNTRYRHFAIVGTRTGIKPDPYLDRVKGALAPQVRKFISEQITRLA